MEELKPCPFCPPDLSDPKIVQYSEDQFIVECCACGCTCGQAESAPEWAAEVWNTRYERTCRFGEPYEAHEYDGMAYPCTECGYEFDEYAHDCFVFCPKCGARVVA